MTWLHHAVGNPTFVDQVAKCCPPQVRSWSGGERERRLAFAFVEACEEVCEVVAGERPVEGFGDLVVVALEVVQRAGELGGAGEVVGGKQLALG